MIETERYPEAHLILQLVSLKVGQFVLSPVLQLVAGNKLDHPCVLVLPPTSSDVNTYLVLPGRGRGSMGGRERREREEGRGRVGGRERRGGRGREGEERREGQMRGTGGRERNLKHLCGNSFQMV